MSDAPEVALAQRLVALETRFGGIQRNVPRGKVSPKDPRPPAQLKKGGMQGGDRMGPHGYAIDYARHLAPFLDRHDLVIVELGILRGSGLALLCELFPTARVIGLDVDLAHWRAHEPELRRRGAFADCEPEVYEFDELSGRAADRFAGLLGAGQAVNLFIDDALHYDDAILGTFAWANRHLDTEGCRYFIEDNWTVAAKLFARYGLEFTISAHGRLTVVR